MDARMAWLVIALVAAPMAGGCDRGPADTAGGSEDVEVDSDLGTLKVLNQTTEPVAIFLDGDELYAIQPGSTSTFRNLPTRRVNIYGVGRISQKHYGLPELTIAEKGDYEWTIRP
ncbi:MAG TPA: hypothetical protein VJ788_07090 [Gemmatimonadota bacterium]|nr:hypothetical protein [Gemmatimonadota bacterium]